VILPYILDLVKESFIVNKNHSGREVAQRVVDIFDIYLRLCKCTCVSILDSVNHGCGFFGSSIYTLIRTGTGLAADGIPNTALRDHMLPVYTFLLLGPGENNRNVLPINGWTTIDQVDIFFTTII